MARARTPLRPMQMQMGHTNKHPFATSAHAIFRKRADGTAREVPNYGGKIEFQEDAVCQEDKNRHIEDANRTV